MSVLTVASKPMRILRQGSLVIDQNQQSISVAGKCLEASPAEFRLLNLLVGHRDLPFSKSAILDALFSPDHGRDVRQIDVFVTRLRQRFNAAGIGDVILTVPGRGYAVLDEDAELAPLELQPRTDMVLAAA